MDTVLIHSTPTMGVRPLGGSGQRSHTLLVRTLVERLGSRAASMFAEPVPSPDGVSIDWYASASDAPQPLTNFPAAKQEPLRRDMIAVVERIGDLVGELEASKRDADTRAAQALRQALRYPDDNYLFVADGRIVVTGWAYEFEDADRSSGDLSTWIRRSDIEPVQNIAPAPPPEARPTSAVQAAAPIPATIIDRRRRWWGLDLLLWLLLALLLILIFWLLLPACEIGLLARAGLIEGCPRAVAGELPATRQQGNVLQAELDRLRRQMAEERHRCRIQQVAPWTVETERDHAQLAGPDSEAEQEFNERLEREEAQRGDLTVSLIWSTDDDLDLVVQCPNGESIHFKKKSACGGRLDVDANVMSNKLMPEPVENVYWPEGDLTPGTYLIGAMLFNRRSSPGASPVPFQIRVQLGDTSQIIDGVASVKKQVIRVTTVDVP